MSQRRCTQRSWNSRDRAGSTFVFIGQILNDLNTTTDFTAARAPSRTQPKGVRYGGLGEMEEHECERTYPEIAKRPWWVNMGASMGGVAVRKAREKGLHIMCTTWEAVCPRPGNCGFTLFIIFMIIKDLN